ncbi:MAG: FIST signal transduction protein [Saprospiraceae bacterium]
MLLQSIAIPYILEQINLQQPEEGSVFLLLFSEQDTPDIDQLVEALNQQNIAFMGGIFPGLLYGNERVDKGCIIKKFNTLLPPFCVSGIELGQLSGLPPFGTLNLPRNGTAIVLFDGLTPNLYAFLEKLNDLLGKQCQFIGGGAGSISLRQQACVFNKEGFFKDAAIVCVVDKRVSIGVKHGWEQMAGPMVATQTEGNTIMQLNWQRAIDVYNDQVEKDTGIRLNKENFASIAQGYPFGIFREKADDIVRDPLAMKDDGSIVCIGEVPPNTVLHILKGRPESLLKAAEAAIRECSETLGDNSHAQETFVVDCITRTLYLNDQFAEEMNIIKHGIGHAAGTQKSFGILSLGELASYEMGLLELFNKTIVIGRFY